MFGDEVGGDVGGVDVDLATVDRVDGSIPFVGDRGEGAEGQASALGVSIRPGWRRRSVWRRRASARASVRACASAWPGARRCSRPSVLGVVGGWPDPLGQGFRWDPELASLSGSETEEIATHERSPDVDGVSPGGVPRPRRRSTATRLEPDSEGTSRTSLILLRLRSISPDCAE